MSGQNLPFSYD